MIWKIFGRKYDCFGSKIFSHTEFFLPISYLPPTVTCCPLFQMYLYTYFALHRSTFNALSTFKISAITISKQALTITKYCISQHFTFCTYFTIIVVTIPVLPVLATGELRTPFFETNKNVCNFLMSNFSKKTAKKNI